MGFKTLGTINDMYDNFCFCPAHVITIINNFGVTGEVLSKMVVVDAFPLPIKIVSG